MGLITVIVPVSSQVKELEKKIEQIESLAEDVKRHDFEFIYLDDGSNAASLQVLEERAETDKRYRVVVLTRDFGLSAQILAGTTYSSGDCAIYFGDDRIDTADVIIELIRHWEAGSKIVIGRGMASTTGYLATILRSRKGFRQLVSLDEISCLLLDKQVVYVLTRIESAHYDLFEFLAWTGFQARLVEYSSQQGEEGKSGYTFQDQTITFTESWKSPRALRRSLLIGILISVIGASLAFGYFFVFEGHEEMFPEWWLFISSMMIVFGMQVGLFGFIGEKLFSSIEMIRDRPAFIVDHMINPPVSSSPEGREKLEKMILSLRNIRRQRNDFLSSESDPAADE